jgi:hypothetical protein
MKKLVLIFLFIILVFTVIVADNYFSKMITNDDIAEGEQVVIDLFTAVNNEDVKGANDTIGRYMAGRYNENNIKKWKPELISVEYVKDDKFHVPPHSYKSNFGHDPFKSMSLRVIYINKIDKETHKSYFTLVKDNKNAQWKIHDWGV